MKVSKVLVFILTAHHLANASLFRRASDLMSRVEKNDIEGSLRHLYQEGCDIEIQNAQGETPLLVACRKGYDKLCSILLENGASLNAKANNGSGPLFTACFNNHYKVCKILLENGATTEERSQYGVTPLQIASKFGSVEICQLLINYKAQIEAVDDLKRTALCYACDSGKEDICALLITIGAKLDVNISGPGITLLHYAAWKGLHKICSILIDKEINKEAVTPNKRTALHIACKEGYQEACETLLSKGCNMDACDKDGRNALHFAAISGSAPLCRLLIQKGALIDRRSNANETALYLACKNGHTGLYKILRTLKADPLIVNDDGWTLLHAACGCEKTFRLCSILIEEGLDIEASTKRGERPLHIACEGGDVEVCKLLISKGANINSKTEKKETPLMLACKRAPKEILMFFIGNKELIKEIKDDDLEGTVLHWACFYKRLDFCEELVKAGFDVNEQANTLSLLHIAINNCNTNSVDDIKLVKFFIANQKNINSKDKDGATPLHYACQQGKNDVVEILVTRKNEINLDMDAKTHTQKTPLHYAVEYNQTECVNLLLKHGALPNELDSFTKTPLLYAAEKKYLEICKLIKKKLSRTILNQERKTLAVLVKGHLELEKLFGFVYDSCAFKKKASIDDDSEGEMDMMNDNYNTVNNSENAEDQISSSGNTSTK